MAPSNPEWQEGPSANVVIVGAGMVGASAALRLAQRGVAVTVCEQGDPGSGTSGTSFAWTNAAGKRPRAYFELNLAGMAAYRRLQAEAGGVLPGFHPTGHLEWGADADGWEAIETKVTEACGWGYAAVRLPTARVLRELEPDLAVDPRRVPEMVFYPDEGHVDPPVLIGWLLRRAAALGAKVWGGARVVGLDAAAGRVCGVRLASGEHLAADAVMCCCGRWTAEVAALAGARIPLVAPEPAASEAVGLLLLTSPLAAAVGRVLSTPELNLRPAGAGRLLLHSRELDRQVAWDAPMEPLPPQAAEALSRLRRLVRHTAAARIEGARIGIRPLPADGHTVAGWAGELGGFYAVVSHSAVTMGPLLGDLVAAEVAGGEASPLLADFRPGRFAVRG